MRATRLVIAALFATLVMGGAALNPARAATTRPADDTWVGSIQRDGSHYDYVGRACPESAALCTAVVAVYRIVPLNPAAARAVSRLSGGPARLVGSLQPGGDGHHTGTLLVRRARRPKPAPATVSVDEHANGTTVHLRPGDHLEVVLHSTYWHFDQPSRPAVISADGPAVYGPGAACPPYPGSGCGTITVRYTAHRPGSARVSAHRDSCGEALRCSPDAARWAIRVAVTG